MLNKSVLRSVACLPPAAVFFALLPLFPSAMLSAATITTSSTCTVPATDAAQTHAGITAISSSRCGVSSDYVSSPDSAIYRLDHQFANASSNFTYATTFNGFTLQPDIALMAAATPVGTAVATLNFSATYITDGPVRPGIMIGLFQPAVGRYGGQYTYSVVAPGSEVQGYGPSRLVPVTLGQPISVSLFERVNSFSDDGTQSYVYLYGGLQLSFFEADGVTPVALSEAPEPTSLAMFGCGLAALSLLGRKIALAEIKEQGRSAPSPSYR